MQSLLFSFAVCLLPSALFCFLRYDFSAPIGFWVDALLLAALLTALLRLWLRVTAPEQRLSRLSDEGQRQDPQ